MELKDWLNSINVTKKNLIDYLQCKSSFDADVCRI